MKIRCSMKGPGAVDAVQCGACVQEATTPRVAAQCEACMQQPRKVRINSFPRWLTLTPVQSGSRGEGELLPKHRRHMLLIWADRLFVIRAQGSREEGQSPRTHSSRQAESADTLEQTVGACRSTKAGYVSTVTGVGALTHLEFLSNTGENTWKKLSFASLLEGTELSKVGSTLLNARLFAGSDSIS